MPGLAELRRLVNISRVQQSVFNERNDAYDHIQPGESVHPAHYRGITRNTAFRETLGHLTYHALLPLVRDEEDVDLLKHLLIVEAQTEKRQAVAKILANRIKKLGGGTATNETVSNPQPRAQ
jgi:hypothetical protein